MKKIKGVVAIEMLILAPFIIGLIYAIAVYGIVFSWQIQMQIAADRSTAAVLRMDRKEVGDPAQPDSAPEVVAASLANGALSAMWPSFMDKPEAVNACKSEDISLTGAASQVQKVALIRCTLTKQLTKSGLQLNLPGVGLFPPLPEKLHVTAAVAY